MWMRLFRLTSQQFIVVIQYHMVRQFEFLSHQICFDQIIYSYVFSIYNILFILSISCLDRKTWMSFIDDSTVIIVLVFLEFDNH